MDDERDEAAFLGRVLDASTGIVFVVDPALNVIYANQAGLDLFGYRRDEMIGRPILDVVDLEWNPLAIESIASALASDGGPRQPMVVRAFAKDGSHHIVRATVNVQLDDPLIGGLVVTCEVWTEQWLLEQSLTSLATGAPIGRTLELLVEVAAAETMGAVASIAHGVDGDHFTNVVRHPDLPAVLAGPGPESAPSVVSSWVGLFADGSGSVVDVADLPEPLRTPAVTEGFRSLWLWSADAGRDLGDVWAIAWRDEPRIDAQETRTETMRRIADLAALSVRRARDQELKAHAATHDSMTGLWNRNAVFGTIADALADDGGPGVGVVYLDLDRFKAVNDEYGHAAGDRVLEEIARRLRLAAPPEGRIGRFGGDEFVYAGPGADLAEVEEIAGRFAAEIMAPITLRTNEVVRVGASTGAAFALPGSVTADQLVERADAELYRIKHDRGDRNRT